MSFKFPFVIFLFFLPFTSASFNPRSFCPRKLPSIIRNYTPAHFFDLLVPQGNAPRRTGNTVPPSAGSDHKGGRQATRLKNKKISSKGKRNAKNSNGKNVNEMSENKRNPTRAESYRHNHAHTRSHSNSNNRNGNRRNVRSQNQNHKSAAEGKANKKIGKKPSKNQTHPKPNGKEKLKIAPNQKTKKNQSKRMSENKNSSSNDDKNDKRGRKGASERSRENIPVGPRDGNYHKHGKENDAKKDSKHGNRQRDGEKRNGNLRKEGKPINVQQESSNEYKRKGQSGAVSLLEDNDTVMHDKHHRDRHTGKRKDDEGNSNIRRGSNNPFFRLSPRQKRALIHARRDLATVIRSIHCKKLHMRRVAELIEQISHIRRCVYNGLQYDDYVRLRAVCRDRSEALEKVRQTKKVCKREGDCWRVERAEKWREVVLEACKKIGWDGDRECGEELNKVKEELEMVNGWTCGSDRSIDELLTEKKKLKMRIKYLKWVGIGKASNAPRW